MKCLGGVEESRPHAACALGGREDKNIHGTLPKRLLVFMSVVYLIAAYPEAVQDLEDTADQP
jgi:hypothetical protein